jgi:hypothetical protein
MNPLSVTEQSCYKIRSARQTARSNHMQGLGKCARWMPILKHRQSTAIALVPRAPLGTPALRPPSEASKFIGLSRGKNKGKRPARLSEILEIGARKGMRCVFGAGCRMRKPHCRCPLQIQKVDVPVRGWIFGRQAHKADCGLRFAAVALPGVCAFRIGPASWQLVSLNRLLTF